MTYSCLHAHCELSIDGVGSVASWVEEAKEKGLYGLAITDHGNCSSMLQLYYAGKEQDFPVVLGSEFYLVESLEKTKENKYCHITVLVKNAAGYKNICRLSTLSYEEGHFYYKPRITLDDLFAHKEGLIVLSGCLLGIIGQTHMKGNPKKATEIARRFKDEFEDDFYLELLPIKVAPNKGKGEFSASEGGCDNVQETVNKILLDISFSLDIKMVATADAHMPREEQKALQDVKLANHSKGWRYEDTYYLPDEQDFRKQFKDNHPYIEAAVVDKMLANTNEIVDKAKDLNLEFKPLLPDVGYEDSYRAMMGFIREGGRIDVKNRVQVDRLMYEIKVIKDNGYINLINYFLLLHDLVKYCKANGVEVGFGRGSAGGSLLAYALGITSVDPIKYDLLFSRFLNEARLKKGALPDIDLDFSNRDLAIDYLKKKYGEARVCKLGTISTLKIKSAIKDTLRQLMGEEFDYALANTLTKNIPNDLDGHIEFAADVLAGEMNRNEFFSDFMEKHPRILETITGLVGTARQMGIHASAVAITPIDISDIIPLATNKGEWYTQYTAKDCEKAGVIKFDILTVNTLNYIAEAIKLVQERHGVHLEKELIPLDDRAVFSEFEKGNTDFVFQFNSDVSKGMLTQVNVNNINDLSLITAIGRPGTMDSGMDREWVATRRGDRSINYPHKALKEVLEETSGIIVYQEQVMKAFQILAGFTEAEADDIRKATGKKDSSLMQSFKERFIAESQKLWPDIDQTRAEFLWKQLETFAGYSFNKSHSVAYALTGYVCQFLKTYYPIEWWAAVAQSINTSKISNKKDKLRELYKVVDGLMVLPDINESGNDFYIKDEKIISPINVLNHVGDASIIAILDARSRMGDFVSFADFLLKINGLKVKKDVIQNLVWAGCFRNIEPGKTEKELVLEYGNIILQKAKGKDREKIQKDIINRVTNMNQIDVAKQQGESLAVYTGNLKNVLKDLVPEGAIFDYSILEKYGHRREAVVVGTIIKIYEHMTKNSEIMAFLDIENDGETFSLTFWPELYTIEKDKLKVDFMVVVEGSINVWKNKKSLSVESVKVLE